MIESLDSRRNLQRRIALVERTQIMWRTRTDLRRYARQWRYTVRDHRPGKRKRGKRN